MKSWLKNGSRNLEVKFKKITPFIKPTKLPELDFSENGDYNIKCIFIAKQHLRKTVVLKSF